MCRGPKKPSSPPLDAASVAMDSDATIKPSTCQPPQADSAVAAAVLLELSADDDVVAFKKVVEEVGLPLETPAPWYSRSFGPASSPVRRMGYELRTPVMIAALYGSTAVLRYILSTKPVNVNRRCGSDGATALHCATAGGSQASLEVVRLLIDASADVDAVDYKGRRPGDVIAKQFSVSMARDLELLLKAPCPRVSSPSKELEAKLGGGERKEYPPDLTFPDIKNGIYGTDEFRMYTFKVKPCSRAYSHDWTECPFVHPGENARRRDPRKYSYSCVPCPDFRKGSCLKGDSCEYAHGVFECWLHPAQYRTRLCKDEIGCNRRVCFFAHKLEELRMVNPTTASITGLVPSPRSNGVPVSSFDAVTALTMMQLAPGSPMSPSGSSAMVTTPSWINSRPPPALQLPSSRLKSSLNARDLDLDLDLMRLEGYQQKLHDELLATATATLSPRSNWKTNSWKAAAASLDTSMLSQLQGLSLKQAAAAAPATGLQFNQSVSQQLLSGYGSSKPCSPTVTASSSFGLDHSLAKAFMNSRQTAFAKRSQSFIDHRAVPRHIPGISAPLTSTPPPSPNIPVSYWASPNGKLDWGIQGDELNELRKSTSFNFQNNENNNYNGLASPTKAAALEEPDLSWVQHLVKDGPSRMTIGRHGLDQQQYRSNGEGDLLSWDQLYGEQEQVQMVA